MIENRHKRMRGIVSSIHTMPPSVNKEFMDLTTKNNNDDGRTEEN
jgi:hypothetical protein